MIVSGTAPPPANERNDRMTNACESKTQEQRVYLLKINIHGTQKSRSRNTAIGNYVSDCNFYSRLAWWGLGASKQFIKRWPEPQLWICANPKSNWAAEAGWTRVPSAHPQLGYSRLSVTDENWPAGRALQSDKEVVTMTELKRRTSLAAGAAHLLRLGAVFVSSQNQSTNCRVCIEQVHKL